MKTANVLIIDYDRGYRRACKNIMELQGFTVSEADDGIHGLRVLCKNNKTDIVLAALELSPQMKGLEFLKEVKALSTQSMVIVFTTNATLETAIESGRLGASHYVVKPVKPEGLVNIVNDCLKGTLSKNAIMELSEKTLTEYLSAKAELDKSSSTNPTAPRAFISYAWEDKIIAKRIMEDLSSHEIEVFIDFSQIVGGDSLPAKINAGLLWSNTVVLIWSKFAAKSYCVNAEWEAAFNLKRRIIPCVLDGTSLPPLLARVLHLRFASYEDGRNNLLQALRAKY